MYTIFVFTLLSYLLYWQGVQSPLSVDYVYLQQYMLLLLLRLRHLSSPLFQSRHYYFHLVRNGTLNSILSVRKRRWQPNQISVQIEYVYRRNVSHAYSRLHQLVSAKFERPIWWEHAVIQWTVKNMSGKVFVTIWIVMVTFFVHVDISYHPWLLLVFMTVAFALQAETIPTEILLDAGINLH